MAPNDPVVRPATLEDTAELARLRWQFRDELAMAPEPFEAFRGRFTRFLEEAFAEGSWAVFVAESGERIVGTVYVQIVPKVPVPNERERHAFCYLTNAYVEPRARGSGIGARLVDAALEWARTREPDAVVLWPSDASVRFWKRAGFSTPADLLELRLER